MSLDELKRNLSDRLTALDGSAGMLDERCIVLSCGGLRGLVVLTDDGRYFIRVSTVWDDQDEASADLPEQVPDKVVELFTGFWQRRGIEFRQPPPTT
jgi:hypothetical protein